MATDREIFRVVGAAPAGRRSRTDVMQEACVASFSTGSALQIARLRSCICCYHKQHEQGPAARSPAGAESGDPDVWSRRSGGAAGNLSNAGRRHGPCWNRSRSRFRRRHDRFGRPLRQHERGRRDRPGVPIGSGMLQRSRLACSGDSSACNCARRPRRAARILRASCWRLAAKHLAPARRALTLSPVGLRAHCACCGRALRAALSGTGARIFGLHRLSRCADAG